MTPGSSVIKTSYSVNFSLLLLSHIMASISTVRVPTLGATEDAQGTSGHTEVVSTCRQPARESGSAMHTSSGSSQSHWRKDRGAKHSLPRRFRRRGLMWGKRHGVGTDSETESSCQSEASEGATSPDPEEVKADRKNEAPPSTYPETKRAVEKRTQCSQAGQPRGNHHRRGAETRRQNARRSAHIGTRGLTDLSSAWEIGRRRGIDWDYSDGEEQDPVDLLEEWVDGKRRLMEDAVCSYCPGR